MGDAQEIKRIACNLQNRELEPIQSYIIMKKLLDFSKEDGRLNEIKERLLQSKWVRELEEAQEANGSWGRFHSLDSSIKRKFSTTEKAINRGLSLGLDGEDDILKRSIDYMTDVIYGRDIWTDRVEKFNEWPVITKVITAATLSKIYRKHPALAEVWKLWASIIEDTFITGEHDLGKEIEAFHQYTGIWPTKRDSKLNKMYPLILMSATDNKLPLNIEKAYIDWIWNNEEGIYYLTWFSMDRLPDITSMEFPSWMRGIDIISEYNCGESIVQRYIDYIWSMRNKEGLWDFGANTKASYNAKTHCDWQLASSWRNDVNRQIDSTIRVLLLLKKVAKRS